MKIAFIESAIIIAEQRWINACEDKKLALGKPTYGCDIKSRCGLELKLVN